MITFTGALLAIFALIFIIGIVLLRLGVMLDAQDRPGTPLRWPEER